MQVDLKNQVVPLLRLAQTAVLLDELLRQVDDCRGINQELHSALKSLNLITCLGSSIAEDLGWVLGLAVDLIQEADEIEAGG